MDLALPWYSGKQVPDEASQSRTRLPGEPMVEAPAVAALDVDNLYRRYGPMVLRRCRFLLRDEEKAVDAMHDVFVNVLNHRETLSGTTHSSLLHKIATNVCLNRLRSDRRKPQDREEELLMEIAAMEDLEGQTAANGVLDRLFGREPESSRTIAVLHLVDGMTLEETAREVGMSVSGIRKRLRTLRERLHALEEV